MTTTRKADFISVAAEVLERGFPITVILPDEKRPLFKKWNDHPTTSLSFARQWALEFPSHHVGVVGTKGIDKLMFLDIDADGVEERIARETGYDMPLTYTVQSRPHSAPFKKHFYFRQTAYSVLKIKSGHNVKDLTRWEKSKNTGLDIHPTLYDVKGTGGGGQVVAAGSIRDNGEKYTVFVDAAVLPVPNYLVDWIVKDVHRHRSEVVKERQARLLRRKEQITQRINGSVDTGDSSPPMKINTYEDVFNFISDRACSLRRLRVDVEDACAIIATLIVKDFENGEELAPLKKDLIHKLVKSKPEGPAFGTELLSRHHAPCQRLGISGCSGDGL